MKLLYLRINTCPGSFEDKPRKKKSAIELTYLERALAVMELSTKGVSRTLELAHKTSDAIWSLFMGRGRK